MSSLTGYQSRIIFDIGASNRFGPSREMDQEQTRYPGDVQLSKRFLDIVLSAVLLLLTSPIILIAAVITRLTSSGPAFYAQTRVGLMGRLFKIYKIRSMVRNSETQTGACWCATNDSRITWFGSFLRSSKIDELPQLWNVLRGDMSLVGPRPERPELMTRLEQRYLAYRARVQVLPGITGLAQVQLPSDTDFLKVGRKLRCDLYYVEHASTSLDVRILLATVLYILQVPFSVTGTVLRLPGWQFLTDEGEEARTRVSTVCDFTI